MRKCAERAMRRFTLDEFVEQLRNRDCTDEEGGFLALGTPGSFMVASNGKLIQIPEPDEEGFVPGWQLDEVLRSAGINLYFMAGDPKD